MNIRSNCTRFKENINAEFLYRTQRYFKQTSFICNRDDRTFDRGSDES